MRKGGEKMAEIDSLEISIQVSADKASKAIDGLIVKLDKLYSALDFGKNIAGIDKQKQTFDSLGETIRGVSGVMDTMKQSMRGISDSVAPQTQKMANTIARIANAGESSERAAKSLPKIGAALSKVTADMAAAKSIDSSVNRFASSIARLANAGDKSAVVAKELPKVGKALKDAADKMASVEGISDSTNAFTQSIAQLASAGDKAGKAAEGLDQLADGTLRFFNTMKNAPQISENTIRMTQAMAQLSATGGKVSASMKPTGSTFKKVGESLKSLSNVAKKASDTIKKALSGIAKIVSGAFSKIGQIGLKASNTMKRVAGDMVAAFSRITHSSKGLNTASSNLSRLLKTIIGFKGIQGLFNFGKNAIKLGSDITEVENVVDTAFGSMAGHAYAFAATAKEQFGLSELAAKQYSGTMMAMLKSSGVMQAQAAKMSTTLAGLAGDIASFYNLETDEAFYKLRSAISGETEPMKALGVNMNIVNLEAFAMSRGITKAYKDMTLAEQATLRYNYILAKTTDAQGDFAKTSGTWANQLRLLKLNFESISAVIGQGLIAAILPAIKWLNALMSKLMEAAKVFRSFMYTLFGKVEGSQGGVVDDLAGSLEDVGDEAEDAGKKIKKNLLLPIDELNILSEETKLEDDLGIGDFDIGDFELDEFEDIDTTPISKWAQAIRDAILAQDWEGLGKTLAELVNAGLQKIYDAIKAITPKVEKALKNFAKVFNSFVNWLDWDLLGKTIGAGINLIVKAFNALFGDDGINLELLGQKLSTGLRGMIEEVNWQELGNAIGNYLMIAWRIAYGFIEDMWRINPETLLTGWAEAGIAIGETLAGIFERIDFVKISSVLTEGFKGALETFTFALNTFSDNLDWIVDKINLGLDRLYDGLKWDSTAGQDMGDKITAFTDSVSTAFNKLLELDFGRVGQIIGAGITDIVRAFNQLTDISGGIDFEGIGTNISNALRGLVTEIPWGELGNALGNGFMVAWRILDGFLTDMAKKSDAGLTGWQEIGVSLGNAINGLFEKVRFSDITRSITNLINGLFSSLKEAVLTIRWSDIADNISSGINTAIENMKWKENGAILNDFLSKFLGMLLKAAEDIEWEDLGRGIGEFLSQIEWKKHLETVSDIIAEVLGGLLEGLGDTPAGKFMISIAKAMISFKLASYILPMVSKFVGFFNSVFQNKSITDAVEKGISNAIGSASSEGATGGILSKIGGFASTIGGILSKLAGIGLVVGGAITAFKNFFDMLKDGFSWVKEILMVVGIALAAVGAVILGAPALVAGVVAAIVAAVGTAVVLIKEHWEGIKEFFYNLWVNIKETAISIWLSIKEFFGGLWNGIVETTQNIWNGVKEFLTGIWQSISETASSIWNGIKEFFVGLWDGILESSKTAWMFISEFLSNSWQFIRESAAEIWGNIKEIFTNVWNGVQETADKVWNSIRDFLKGAWEGIFNTAKEIWNGIMEFFGSLFGNIQETAQNIWDSIKKFLSEVWNQISNTASEIWNGIGDFIKTVWDGISEIFHNVWEGIKGFLTEIWNGIGEKAEEIWNKVKDFFSDLWSGIQENAKTVWTSVKETLSAIWEDTKEKAESIWNGIKQFFMSTWDGFKEKSADTWGNIKNTLFETWNNIKNTAESVWGSIKGFFKGIWEGVGEGIGEAFGKAIEGVKSAWNSFAGWLNERLKFDIPPINIFGNQIFDGATIDLGKLPTFATGGFPEDGIFMANHTELVGQFSNGRTAVANNAQITDGIRQASYEGMMQAISEMFPYLADIAENTRRTAEKDMSVNIGDRDIYNANKRGAARAGMDFSDFSLA